MFFAHGMMLRKLAFSAQADEEQHERRSANTK